MIKRNKMKGFSIRKYTINYHTDKKRRKDYKNLPVSDFGKKFLNFFDGIKDYINNLNK